MAGRLCRLNKFGLTLLYFFLVKTRALPTKFVWDADAIRIPCQCISNYISMEFEMHWHVFFRFRKRLIISHLRIS